MTAIFTPESHFLNQDLQILQSPRTDQDLRSGSSAFWVCAVYWYWKGQTELGSVEHLWNSNTWDVEAGGLGIQSHP